MKRFISLLCMVVMASSMMLSCDKSDGSGEGEKKKEFATIEVVSNERCDKSLDGMAPAVAEKLKAVAKIPTGPDDDVAPTMPSVKFTVKVDVKDDSDTRDYLIGVMPAPFVERQGGNMLSSISKYFKFFDMATALGQAEMWEGLEMFGIIKNGDVEESADLYDLYPILGYEKQYVVCVPIEDARLMFAEASVSQPISVARLVDASEITFPDNELACTIEFENIEPYSFNYKIEGLDENECYQYSCEKESVFNSLSPEELHVRFAEKQRLLGGMVILGDPFFGFFEDIYDVDMAYDTDNASGDMDVDCDDTNYVFYVYSGSLEDGMPTSKFKTAVVKSAKYATPTGQLAGFKNLEAEMNDFTVEIDNGTYTADNAYYLVTVISYEEMKMYDCTTVEELAPLLVEYAKLGGMDFTSEKDMYKGYIDEYDNYWLSADSDYVVLAFGVSAKGDIITNIISQDFKTLPIPEDFSVTIDLHASDHYNFNCTFTPSASDVKYSIEIVESSHIDGLSDTEIVKLLEYSDVGTTFSGSGERTLTANNIDLDSSTDYTICVYVANSKCGLLMPMVKQEFSTTGLS